MHENTEKCAFCKRGELQTEETELAFNQLTDKGYVACRVIVPITVCSECNMRRLSPPAEAIIEEAVAREYAKLS
jgi:hypothetical protein